MKILILLLAIAFMSCNNRPTHLEKANDLIETQRKIMYADSVSNAQRMELEIAKMRYEKATGKKDTLTREERLKKAREDFK